MTGEEVVATEEIRRLQARVGRTLRSRLQWALDFAQKDLGQLPPEEWANLRREFAAFRDVFIPPDAFDDALVRTGVFGERARPGSGGRRKAGGVARKPSSLALLPWKTTAPSIALPTEAEVRAIQRLWRDNIYRFFAPDPLKTFGPLHFRLHTIHNAKGARAYLNAEEDAYALPQLLIYLGACVRFLHTCREEVCRRWFVARRKGQVFCSRRCQNRAAIRAKRERDRQRNSERATGVPGGRDRGTRRRRATRRRR